MSQEILALIEKGNSAFEEFKRVSEETNSKTAGEIKEAAERAFNAATDAQKSIEALEAKMNRQGLDSVS